MPSIGGQCNLIVKRGLWASCVPTTTKGPKVNSSTTSIPICMFCLAQGKFLHQTLNQCPLLLKPSADSLPHPRPFLKMASCPWNQADPRGEQRVGIDQETKAVIQPPWVPSCSKLELRPTPHKSRGLLRYAKARAKGTSASDPEQRPQQPGLSLGSQTDWTSLGGT